MEFVVEATCIAHWLTIGISAPQGSIDGIAVRALEACATCSRLSKARKKRQRLEKNKFNAEFQPTTFKISNNFKF